MRFLDANIFLRYLIPGDAEKSQACFQLFQRIKNGDEDATTSESVIAEVTYILRSRAHYGLAPGEISTRLRPILALRSLKVTNKKSFVRAFELWDEYPALDFEDVLSVAHMERLGIDEIFSYDRDFDGIAEIARLEP